MEPVFDNNLVNTLEELSADPSFPEILWNFSRYKDRARITLEQNPHFYLRCPTDERAYTARFRRRPLQDPSGALEHNGTVYVLFDRPGRVFLTTEHKPRIFGNVWSLNGFLIFRGLHYISQSHRLLFLTYFQIAPEYLRESNLSEVLMYGTIYGVVRSQWCPKVPRPVPD